MGGVRYEAKAYAKDKVGAGRNTRQKSATRAMTTLAATKSISFMKLFWRLVYSAVDLVNRPIPTWPQTHAQNLLPAIWGSNQQSLQTEAGC